MRVKVVTLSYAPSLGGFDERPLADFVRDKEVLAVREHFFTVHDLPHLACLITYQDVTAAPREASPSGPCSPSSAPRTERPRGDLPDLVASLPPEDRVLFGTLREWRAARARKEGVPPYVLFTNRELLAVVRARPASLSALGALDGIGAGKVERYGRALLEKVNGTQAAAPPPAAPAAPPAPASPAPGAAP
jgi:ATP-dependent DNA helicase RecQ